MLPDFKAAQVELKYQEVVIPEKEPEAAAADKLRPQCLETRKIKRKNLAEN